MGRRDGLTKLSSTWEIWMCYSHKRRPSLFIKHWRERLLYACDDVTRALRAHSFWESIRKYRNCERIYGNFKNVNLVKTFLNYCNSATYKKHRIYIQSLKTIYYKTCSNKKKIYNFIRILLNRFMQILYFIRDRFRWQKNCDLFKQK